ncbi:MAG: hypothetical protein H6710_23380 [Myxococcales bacterium]|nr:hypothetical protein [Myxococcales bacterium]MCB9706978.1 hypothetical protein [Myxococcales bacterium]
MIQPLLLVIALAGPEADSIHRADLDVDTSALGGDGPIIQERIRERVGVKLREAEILPARALDEPRLEITLRPGDAGEFSFAYELRLLVGDPRRIPVKHHGECASCTEGELVERLVAAVDQLLPELREHSTLAPASATEPTDPEAGAAPLEGPAEVEGPAPPEPVDVDPGPAPPRLGPLGKAGLAAISVGAAAAVLGVVLALRPPTPLEDRPLYVRNTRPPGLAVAISGGGLLVGGVTLMLVDRARRRGRDRR